MNASPWPLTMFVSILTVAFGTAPALEASVTIVATAHRDRAPRKGSGTPSGPCIASAGVGATGLLGAAVTQRYNCSYSMRGTWADRGNARPRMQQSKEVFFVCVFFPRCYLLQSRNSYQAFREENDRSTDRRSNHKGCAPSPAGEGGTQQGRHMVLVRSDPAAI